MRRVVEEGHREPVLGDGDERRDELPIRVPGGHSEALPALMNRASSRAAAARTHGRESALR